MIEYVSHLRGTDNATVCGAPWQRWQQHEDDRDSPLEWFEKPRKQDPIHQCQLCLDVTRRFAEIDPMPDPAWSDSGRGEGCNEC